MYSKLAAIIKGDEGFRSLAYDDADGKTIKQNGKKIVVGRLTIGWGRNIQEKGISFKEAEMLLENDIRDAELDARALIQNFDDLSEYRKIAFICMAFQLGRTRMSGFYNMLLAISKSNWDVVAEEMLNSLWARQTKNRAGRLADMVRKG